MVMRNGWLPLLVLVAVVAVRVRICEVWLVRAGLVIV